MCVFVRERKKERKNRYNVINCVEDSEQKFSVAEKKNNFFGGKRERATLYRFAVQKK